LIILLISTPGTASPDRGIIGEIVIIGPTRTEEDIIRRQLPFAEGDYWQEEYGKLVSRRIEALNVFHPLEIRVLTEPINEGYFRVVIRATDTDLLYVDPVEMAVFKTVDLFEKQFNQEIRSPFGRGVVYSMGFGWSSNPWWEAGFSYPLAKGLSLNFQHLSFETNSVFNNLRYQEKGFKDNIHFKQVLSADWELGYGFGYRDNEYQLSGEGDIHQQYVLLSGEAIWKGGGQLLFALRHMESLKEGQPSFTKLSGDYVNGYQFLDGIFILRLQCGLLSSETSLNMQFHGGGFSEIPLRAYQYNLAGDRYLRGGLEYHRALPVSGLRGIIFTDAGKILHAGWTFEETELLLKGGIGLAYDTSMEIPVSLDLAFNQEGDFNWKLGFGHSF